MQNGQHTQPHPSGSVILPRAAVYQSNTHAKSTALHNHQAKNQFAIPSMLTLYHQSHSQKDTYYFGSQTSSLVLDLLPSLARCLSSPSPGPREVAVDVDVDSSGSSTGVDCFERVVGAIMGICMDVRKRIERGKKMLINRNELGRMYHGASADCNVMQIKVK